MTEDTPVLLLYYKPTCSFCQKVLKFLDEIGRTVPLKDISREPDARDELQHLGGKVQVPCLFIDGKALYESDEIIDWLKSNYQENPS